MPGQYTVDFSIEKVKKNWIVTSFQDDLLQNETEVSEIQLKPNESIQLHTQTVGGGTSYTFSIVDSIINFNQPENVYVSGVTFFYDQYFCQVSDEIMQLIKEQENKAMPEYR